MRNAVRPSSRSVGTRSRNAMSSSMLTESCSFVCARHRLKAGVHFKDHALRHQLVAAGVCYQNRRIRRIFLDLLPQSVNMGLKRMGGDARVVTPHLLQQRLARHWPLPGTIEIAQDGGFFFSEPNLAAFGTHQQLRTRPERVRADGEYRVLASLVLAKLRADAGQ